jgi:hypothetical protein
MSPLPAACEWPDCSATAADDANGPVHCNQNYVRRANAQVAAEYALRVRKFLTRQRIG